MESPEVSMSRLTRLLPLTALAATLATAGEPPRLALRWDVLEQVFPDGPDSAHTRAALTLRHLGGDPLPATGWSLHFNATGKVEAGHLTPGFTLQALNGDLWRLGPAQGLNPLAPGGTWRIEYRTEEALVRIADAPSGAYLVLDQAPGVAYPVPVEAGPLDRPEQVRQQAGETWVPQRAALPATAKVRSEDLPPVFPTPKAWMKGTGHLSLGAGAVLVVPPALQPEGARLADLLGPHLGARPVLRPQGEGQVHLELRQGLRPEHYVLDITPKGLTLAAADRAGLFYGLQSLARLLPAQARPSASLTLPALRVEDGPRFGYRGLHLDVARNFQPKAQVLRVLDLMASLKLNRFHFHLTDDEGWRLEVPELPELTQVGARRGHSTDPLAMLPPSFGSGPADQAPGSGHYSRADLVEILRHATRNHIEVILELEMPGHARAAVVAMEARARRLAGTPQATQFRLRDPRDASRTRSVQGWTDNLMDPGLDSTYAFIETVVDSVQGLYREAGAPLTTIHMGGDEVPAGAWSASPASQALLQRLGTTDPTALWRHFYARVDQILARRGLTTSGWEELGLRHHTVDGQPRVDTDPLPEHLKRRIYVWNNVIGWGAEDRAYQLANAGFPVVLASVTHLYFDLAWARDPREPGQAWGGFVDLEKPFKFTPLDSYLTSTEDVRGKSVDPSVFQGKERLTEKGKAHILGIQGCLWGENLRQSGDLDAMLVPKVFGLAERAWAPDPAWSREPDARRRDAQYRQAWAAFLEVLKTRELPRLQGWAFRKEGY